MLNFIYFFTSAFFTRPKIYSYKTDGFKYQPKKSVALFHGEPKITDCLDHEVVRKHWNVGTTREN